MQESGVGGGKGAEAVLVVLAVLLSSSLSQCTVLCCGGPDGLFELGGQLLLENEIKTPTEGSASMGSQGVAGRHARAVRGPRRQSGGWEHWAPVMGCVLSKIPVFRPLPLDLRL